MKGALICSIRKSDRCFRRIPAKTTVNLKIVDHHNENRDDTMIKHDQNVAPPMYRIIVNTYQDACN